MFWFKLVIFILGSLLVMPGCNVFPNDNTPLPSDGGQGGNEPLPEGTFHIPFADGEIHLCTQGAGGNYSHQSGSTFDSLDLDTSNSSQEEIYAPVSGVAYVHLDNSDSGFGYHINIDLGDGTFFVLAHMSEIFVEDNVEVVQGQLLGYEGCTGNCTGDHLHMGLQQGDPQQMAQHSTSLLTSYYVTDATEDIEYYSLPSDEFVCDLYDGHHYQSHLRVASWHPDGTLLIYPDTGEVFVVDQGQIFWIENEEVFWSYGFNFADTVAISERELMCWEEGSASISNVTEYQAVEDEQGQTWLAYESENNPGRSRQLINYQVVPEVVNSWGVTTIYNADSEEGGRILSNYPVVTGTARLRDGTLVQENGSAEIYVVHEGFALPIKDWSTYLLLGFEHRFVFEIPQGSLDLAVREIGSCDANAGCVTSDVVTSCGNDLSITFSDGDDDDHPSHGDDDDVVSDDDDDDDTVSSDDDDTWSDDDDSVGDDDDDTGFETDWLLLEIEAGLSGPPADYIWLAGELLDENDSPSGGGFWWSDLEYQANANVVTWSAYVLEDWTLRYSVEYQRYGVVSWSCLAPFPPGTLTMDLSAHLDGQEIQIQSIDNNLGGCELYLET
jgi:hypothetical protein